MDGSGPNVANAAGRAYSAAVERISAIVQRPRLFYVPNTSMSSTALGCPAFTLEGKVLGVFVMRAMKGKGGGGLGMFNMQPDNLTAIIVPADDIVKAIKQVPAAVEEKEKKKSE